MYADTHAREAWKRFERSLTISFQREVKNIIKEIEVEE